MIGETQEEIALLSETLQAYKVRVVVVVVVVVVRVVVVVVMVVLLVTEGKEEEGCSMVQLVVSVVVAQ